MKLRQANLLLSLFILVTAGTVQAEKLKDSVSKAVLTHPSVLAKWHEFKESGFEREVSSGENLPKVDVLVGSHRESQYPTPAIGEKDYSTDIGKITLQQNIFNGFGTHNKIMRLDHVSRVRYFDLMDASETAALEAARAYINLYRQKVLLEFAQENYVVHRSTFEQLNRRVKAGISASVDFEMAGARLAVAESDLLVQAGNLHDATAYYQNIVGNLPVGDIDPPPGLLAKAMPKTRAEAIAAGFKTSPQLKAAVENILAAQRKISVERSALYPRIDFVAERSIERNPEGVPGDESRTTIGFTINFNLFDGMRDIHRIGGAVEAASMAKDDRETVCRNLRQNLAMNFNESDQLTKKLPLLDQHQLSADKSREALRKQFDIGQRTLLDVLDTEKEYFTARRDYFNGEVELAIAQAKYLAGSGILLSTLKLEPLEAVPPEVETALDEDAAQHCPPDAVPDYAPKQGSYIVLLNNPDGTTGQVIVTGNKGEQVIDKAMFAVPMDGSQVPEPVSEEKLKADFGDAMSARPPLPESLVLHFQSNSTKLTKESSASLVKVIDRIASHPAAEVTIRGYTDTVGSTKVNQVLGLKRANVVADQLKARQIKLQSLEIESRGELALLVPNTGQHPRAT